MSDAEVEFHTEEWEPAAPGSEAFFSFSCPAHKGRRCEFLLIRDADGGGSRPSWIWNGDRAAPTFSPSVNHKGCWHGYVEKGRCVTVGKVDEPEPAS